MEACGGCAGQQTAAASMSDDQEPTSPAHANAQAEPKAQWPKHTSPRAWFLSNGQSPIAIALGRRLIDHGDCVALGLPPAHNASNEDVEDEVNKLFQEVEDKRDSRKRLRKIHYDLRSMSACQAAIASAIEAFGQLDVLLCCNGEALIGTIEEATQSKMTEALVTSQFNNNTFGPINLIKAALPPFRQQRNGHIILMSGITGHIGTPGLALHCASQWAIEGYCDSLAYEVAPFNIKMSIVQSSIEVSILTNKITSAPGMAEYSEAQTEAPLARKLWASILDRLDAAFEGKGSDPGDGAQDANIDPALGAKKDGERAPFRKKPSELLHSEKAAELYPRLPEQFKDSLIAETIHALTAIGGHANPPARHIVGYEGIASVKEKLRTVSEELEDFVEVSTAVDYAA